MSANKTQPTDVDVEDFIDSIPSNERRAECRELVELMRRVTGEPPRMWGPGMVGFGSYHYRYESGREGDYFIAGFAPRKSELSIYVMSGFEPHTQLLGRLGRHRTGKSCLYVRRLADIDQQVLAEMIERSVELVRQRYSETT